MIQNAFLIKLMNICTLKYFSVWFCATFFLISITVVSLYINAVFINELFTIQNVQTILMHQFTSGYIPREVVLWPVNDNVLF